MGICFVFCLFASICLVNFFYYLYLTLIINYRQWLKESSFFKFFWFVALIMWIPSFLWTLISGWQKRKKNKVCPWKGFMHQALQGQATFPLSFCWPEHRILMKPNYKDGGKYAVRKAKSVWYSGQSSLQVTFLSISLRHYVKRFYVSLHLYSFFFLYPGEYSLVIFIFTSDILSFTSISWFYAFVF